ncbi:MAG: hypothetical protein GY953_31480 [bacterium]|nr:hypothetical protein [bacterium]
MAWLVAIFALLVLAGCGPGVPSHVPIDPALASLVPSDTVMLAGARIDQLSETPVFEQLMTAQPPEQLDQLLHDTGLDPAEDLWELLFASNGDQGVLMVRGKFSESGMEPRVDWQGAERMPYRGYLMIGDAESAVLFVNTTTALLGKPELLRAIIDDREKSAGIPAPLLETVESIEYGNQVWLAAVDGWSTPPETTGNLGNFWRLLDRIESITMAANFRSGMFLVAEGACASAEEAESLEGALRAILGLARLGARDRPATASLIENTGLNKTESVVELTLDVAPELLKQVLREMSEQER